MARFRDGRLAPTHEQTCSQSVQRRRLRCLGNQSASGISSELHQRPIIYDLSTRTRLVSGAHANSRNAAVHNDSATGKMKAWLNRSTSAATTTMWLLFYSRGSRAAIRPGEILYAGNTPGTVPSLTGDMLKQRAGIDLTFVPYPGAAAAIKDLMGWQISIVIESGAGLTGAIQGGSLKLLAVSSDKRVPQFPNVPTVAETLPGFEATGWFALLARAGTPDAIVQKISRELRASLADAGLQEHFAKLSTEPAPMSPPELHAFIEREQKS